ncbi:hypothetical protein ERX37_06545 [Macrococcus hajekii]|uniref:Uncharacterized protein n=1 Tax=Macrococcus hajekii TaxID=198482 RepID=A0A4V6PPN8_9STAP|nr:hypothetical protein [Macrococcus hajekii]TDM01864.1 hypothetical protein ERX37_06545 [Macrococcus hajekii]GGB08146.1 hypothetical protein GCM10007190_15110 [Macrococcus hajekii]
MFKNILLAVVSLINLIFIFLIQGHQSVNHIDIHIIVAALAVILSVLFLIVRTTRLNFTLAIITLLIAAVHISLIVMHIYNYVYA